MDAATTEADDPTNPLSNILCFSGLFSSETASCKRESWEKAVTSLEAENTSPTGFSDVTKANLSFELIYCINA